MSSTRSSFLVFICCVCTSQSKYLYETKYLDVLLDHFSFVDNRTFALRYLINDSYWQPDHGPIFFYTGNEGNIEVFAQNTGFMWEMAPTFDALLLFAEHRYYGVSMPFGNESLSDPEFFGYLTSEQALADFVDVLSYVKQNHRRKEKRINPKKRLNPVIAFGGSYGGMLAAWMRMKYPAVIEGALAASAPIWQFTGMTPCLAYNKALTAAFNASGGVTCVKNIRKSWNAILNITESDSGKKWLSDQWQLCKPLKTNDNVTGLINWLTEVYSSLAMINYPYPTNFLMPVPANPTKEFCSHLNESSLNGGSLLQHLFDSVSVYFNFTGNAKCLDWCGDPSPGLDAAGWNIQACTEIVMPLCSNGVTDMFLPAEWNFSQYSDSCYRNFQVRPREYMAEKEYGGEKIDQASNIIFSNGLLDPWMSGGVTHSVSRNTIVIVLPGAAHHLDIRGANPNDPSSVVKARKLYANVFRRWIRNYRERHHFPTSSYDKHLNRLSV